MPTGIFLLCETTWCRRASVRANRPRLRGRQRAHGGHHPASREFTELRGEETADVVTERFEGIIGLERR